MAIEAHPTDNALLSKPSNTNHATHTRTPSHYSPLPTYDLPRGEHRHYQQQYADMYFARLAQLKPPTEAIAAEAWSDFTIANETARKVDRVLDVRQGELCWMVGTVFMEMPLKPNVLEDIGKEHWIAAPPPRVKYTDEGKDAIMLEDESGRLRLTGAFLGGLLVVTGAIVGVLGTENRDGEFEVLDIRFPDLPRQPPRWERVEGEEALMKKSVRKERLRGGKVAVVSGLGISGEDGDTLRMDLLMEWLIGEAAGSEDQEDVATISRLIIAGNSLYNGSPIPTREEVAALSLKNRGSGQKRYGYDSASFNPAPTTQLDTWLATLLPSLPITLLPGERDPTSSALPQQPIHPAMFPRSRAYTEPPDSTSQEPSWFTSTSNPAEFDLDGWRFLGTGGQPVNDIYKYVSGEERLEMMEAMLRWRLSAPTAPDTLWCYPFQDGDAFVMRECPHVFFVGNQPKFETSVIEGPTGQQVRLVAVPAFRETGEICLVDMESLEVEVVRFEAFEGGEGG